LKAVVEIGGMEYIEHHVPDMVVNDADAHYTEDFFGYEKALVGTFGARLNPDTDAGMRTIPVLPDADKALLIEGKAIDIRKSAFNSPRALFNTDELHLTYNREYIIGGNVIQQEVFKKTYEINRPMTATHVTTFNFANALGYVHTALCVTIGEDGNATRKAEEEGERKMRKSTINWNPYCRAEEDKEPTSETNRLIA